MSDAWQSYVRRIEELAARSGLAFHPVDFEAVPDSFMMEIAVYGLPVRMPHWSFGVRYIYQLIQRHMGRSEEHTSELQSQSNLVCRLLLEKKKKNREKGSGYGIHMYR